MGWTEKQYEAITDRRHDLLVSAAAGSGKTAVLVERIKKLVIEEGVSPENLLVVTFTRAAASEMREKISDAVSEAIIAAPERAGELSKVIHSLARADIKTFDAFALDVVRKYYYVTGVDPGLKMCDEAEAAIMKNEAMDDVFAKRYDEHDEDFMRFLDAYSDARSDKKLKKNLIEIYDKVRNMSHPFDRIKKQAKILEMNEEDFLKSPIMEELTINAKREVDLAARIYGQTADILNDAGFPRLAGLRREDEGSLACGSDFDEISRVLAGFKAHQMRRVGDESKLTEEWEAIKPKIERLNKNAKEKHLDKAKELCACSIAEEVEVMNKTAPFAHAMIGILEEFDAAYREKKTAAQQMDFADSSHYAIDILADENVAGELRDKYEYIFIDEYQDSNYLQEEIIGAIRRDDNVFMVGDIKQSIYGFRQAEPNIFKGRYEEYARGTDEKKKKIDLSSNFRSLGGVIKAVNSVFSEIMPDYGEEARLNQGAGLNAPEEPRTELHIVDMAPSSVIKRIDVEEDEEDTDDEFEELERMEMEAAKAAEIVAEHLGKEIYDVKTSEMRPLRKKDIVILLRGMKNTGEKYYKALLDKGIDAYIEDNKGYFNTVEIETFVNLLRVIDNGRQDIPLLSVLSSPIFEFTMEELAEIRLSDRKAYYHEAFLSFDEDSMLGEKVRMCRERLDAWRKQARFMKKDEFCWQLMMETGYYDYAGALPGGTQRQANLRTFIDKAQKFSQNQDPTIGGLLNFIEALKNSDLETGQAGLAGEDDDIVRIMTVHKSKGLEFPIVILAGLGKNFNVSDTSGKTGMIHKDLGFSMDYVNTKEHYRRKTLVGRVIRKKLADEEREEEIRILYVAMTRAASKLILLGSDKDWEDKKEKIPASASEATSYLEMIYPPKDPDAIEVFEIHSDELKKSAAKSYKYSDREDRIAGIEVYDAGENAQMAAFVKSRLEYEYPWAKDLELKSKYSVSELNRKEPSQVTLKTPVFAQEDEKIKGAALGTVMHTVMEHMDFAKTYEEVTAGNGEPYVKEAVSEMVKKGVLTDEEGRAVAAKEISGFFESEIGARAARAARDGKLKKEKRFNILHEKDGREVIVQGVIDCFFEEGDALVLIDYKTNYLTDDIEELYREQMTLYEEALEKVTGRRVTESYLYLFSKNKAVSAF